MMCRVYLYLHLHTKWKFAIEMVIVRQEIIASEKVNFQNITATILLKKSLLQIWNDISFVFKQLTPQDFIITALITTIGMFGAIIFMTGLSLFIYQAILWLQQGTWTEFPLFVVFDFRSFISDITTIFCFYVFAYDFRFFPSTIFSFY